MAKITTKIPKQPEPHDDPNTVIVHETRTVDLPDPPQIPAGKMGFRMVYHTGAHRDIIGESRFDCTGKAIKQATSDKMNFQSDDIISFKKVK